MPRNRLATLAMAILCAIALALPGPVVGARPDARGALAKNVIVLIDDGAGYNHHIAGSLYDKGDPAAEAYNDFPFRFAMKNDSYGDVAPGACPAETFGYDPALAWSDFDYVIEDWPDSASTATAMATGVKTYDSAIGVGCDAQPVENVVELAESLGKSTGVITSVPFSHATPGAFVAHQPNRDDYFSIASDMIWSSATDVIMGAGHPLFDDQARPKPALYRWISKPDYDALVAGTAGGDADGDGTADPWTLLTARSEFQALASGPTPARVFGLAKVRRSLQVDRGGLLTADAYVVPFVQTVPTLVEMTAGAINVLDDDPQGFFLMIEGGATDLASHDTFSEGNKSGRMIEEEISFDRAVDEVLRWVDANSNWGETLVVVASDHETGYLTGPGSGATADGPVWTSLVNNGAGVMPGMAFHVDLHSRSLVPVYAKGDAGRALRPLVVGTDPVRGRYIDNTDIHTLVVDAMSSRER